MIFDCAEISRQRSIFEEYIFFTFSFPLEDTVFLDKEDARREYVLNDVGKIFVGTQKEPRGRRWIYGQVSNASFHIIFMIFNANSKLVGITLVIFYYYFVFWGSSNNIFSVSYA